MDNKESSTTADYKPSEQTGDFKPCKETDDSNPCEQTQDSEPSEETRGSEQTEQTQDSEPSEETRGSEQSEQTQDSEPSEETRGSEQSEQTQDSEPSEETRGSEQTEQTQDSEPSEETRGSEQSEQTQDSEPSEETRGSEQSEQTRDSLQSEQTQDIKPCEKTEDFKSSEKTNDSQPGKQTQDFTLCKQAEDYKPFGLTDSQVSESPLQESLLPVLKQSHIESVTSAYYDSPESAGASNTAFYKEESPSTSKDAAESEYGTGKDIMFLHPYSKQINEGQSLPQEYLQPDTPESAGASNTTFYKEDSPSTSKAAAESENGRGKDIMLLHPYSKQINEGQSLLQEYLQLDIPESAGASNTAFYKEESPSTSKAAAESENGTGKDIMLLHPYINQINEGQSPLQESLQPDTPESPDASNTAFYKEASPSTSKAAAESENGTGKDIMLLHPYSKQINEGQSLLQEYLQLDIPESAGASNTAFYKEESPSTSKAAAESENGTGKDIMLLHPYINKGQSPRPIKTVILFDSEMAGQIPTVDPDTRDLWVAIEAVKYSGQVFFKVYAGSAYIPDKDWFMFPIINEKTYDILLKYFYGQPLLIKGRKCSKQLFTTEIYDLKTKENLVYKILKELVLTFNNVPSIPPGPYESQVTRVTLTKPNGCTKFQVNPTQVDTVEYLLELSMKIKGNDLYHIVHMVPGLMYVYADTWKNEYFRVWYSAYEYEKKKKDIITEEYGSMKTVNVERMDYGDVLYEVPVTNIFMLTEVCPEAAFVPPQVVETNIISENEEAHFRMNLKSACDTKGLVKITTILENNEPIFLFEFPEMFI